MKVYTSFDTPDTKGIKELEGIAEKTMHVMMQMHKYRTMWQLRSLENEINADGGIIIVNGDGKIEIKGFRSQELVENIKAILSANPD